MSERHTLSLSGLITENKGRVAAIALLIIVSSSLSSYPIKLIEVIVDTAVDPQISEKIQKILSYGAIYISFFLAASGCRFLLNYLSRTTEAKTGHLLRLRLFDRIMHLPQFFFSQRSTGDIAADLLKDSEITTSATREEIRRVTEWACLNPVLQRCSEGLSTYVGENGLGFSLNCVMQH